ncbi:hypothetical protein GM30_12460 [Trabulsiella odontotermitis]|nr:hypothetical protein GM30_12460 [Trabulsiella odontotermitis]
MIEDAAHAAGTYYKNRHVGWQGTAIFSFHAIKNMTSAEGGLVVTDDDQLAARIRSLKFHGLGVDAYDRQTHGRAPQAEVISPGYKYNLADINAALALVQLGKLGQANQRRHEIGRTRPSSHWPFLNGTTCTPGTFSSSAWMKRAAV